MPETSTLFWDIGGVLLTNGWDRRSATARASSTPRGNCTQALGDLVALRRLLQSLNA